MRTQVVDEITSELDSILGTMKPSARRKLAKELALMLRGEMSAAILANKEPDGSAMAPRLSQRSRKAKTGKMFKKLGMRRSMKVRQSARSASVEFQPKNARIAAVHHFGLTSRVNKHGTTAKYIARELLGFNDPLEEKISTAIIDHIAGE